MEVPSYGANEEKWQDDETGAMGGDKREKQKDKEE